MKDVRLLNEMAKMSKGRKTKQAKHLISSDPNLPQPTPSKFIGLNLQKYLFIKGYKDCGH